jgi:CPA2 family monovalent cation:H+ antiporter-2
LLSAGEKNDAPQRVSLRRAADAAYRGMDHSTEGRARGVDDFHYITDLVLALGAAWLGGMIAQWLRQPVLLGYIVAGILIGPNTPGLVADRAQVETLANLGVAFLMFALGVEFSFSELRRVRRVALIAGGLQIPLTILLGIVAGLAIGWSWQAAALLGGGFAISSSIVALKLAMGQGGTDTPQARTALGLSIVQDLSLVPMIALIPVLAGETENLAVSLVRSLLTAAVALGVVILLGTRLVPPVLYAVARTRSRELFLLAIVLIALGTALASQAAGLSLALGAFLAGLVVSESEFESQVLAEIIPLRDLFATLFFVAVGMLISPGYILDHAQVVAGLVLTLVVGKLLITGGALLAAGVDHRTSTLAATLLAQIGEFSFVLASVGMAEGIIGIEQYGLILAVALGSILLAAPLQWLDSALVIISNYLPGVRSQEAAQVGREVPTVPRRGHVVLCGYGRVGRVLGDELARHGFSYSVIELNPATVRELRRQAVPAHYGDAGSGALLRRAGIERASVLVVTVTDLVAARAAIRQARELNPRLTIVTRATTQQEVAVLQEAGADEVIQPEFEAGLECVHHVLQTLGVPGEETAEIVANRRLSLYREPAAPIFVDAGEPA